VDTQASLVVVTHSAPESRQRQALESLQQIPEVLEVAALIRVLRTGTAL